MSRFRVVICGGGIAAVEGLLRLRRLAGEDLGITLLSPAEELRYRPVAVQEPFSRPGARRYLLRRIAQRTDAEWVKETLEWVDPDGQLVHTAEGHSLPFDALLVAIGARATVPYDHVTVFDDARPDETYHGIVQDIEEGYTKSLALLLPQGPTWPLPIYELALMTAERARSMSLDDLRVDIVTDEPAPLAPFGEGASEAVAALLERFGVTVHTNAQAEVPASRRLVVQPTGLELEPDRIVAMPLITGPGIRGLPTAEAGFIPIDGRCRGARPWRARVHQPRRCRRLSDQARRARRPDGGCRGRWDSRAGGRDGRASRASADDPRACVTTPANNPSISAPGSTTARPCRRSRPSRPGRPTRRL